MNHASFYLRSQICTNLSIELPVTIESVCTNAVSRMVVNVAHSGIKYLWVVVPWENYTAIVLCNKVIVLFLLHYITDICYQKQHLRIWANWNMERDKSLSVWWLVSNYGNITLLHFMQLVTSNIPKFLSFVGGFINWREIICGIISAFNEPISAHGDLKYMGKSVC